MTDGCVGWTCTIIRILLKWSTQAIARLLVSYELSQQSQISAMFDQAWMPCCRTCTVLVLLYVQLPVISKSTDTDVTGACGGDSDLHTYGVLRT